MGSSGQPPKQLGFIGLGVMGAPMAGHLAKAGYQLKVYNRSAEKARAWVERFGGQACESPAQVAEDCELLLSCVGNDDDLRQICLGEQGAYAQLPAGAVHIDHTTASAQVARDLAARAQALGLEFIDAPVSGGQAGAENAQLGIMCGGDSGCFERIKPVLDVYAKSIGLIGPVGSGQLCKMVNQICVAGVVQGLAEGLRFGEQAGLDMSKVLQVIEHGAAGSWQMSHRGQTMLQREFDFGFAVDWMRKDLGIVADEAANHGMDLPITKQIAGFYDALSANQHGRMDTSALILALDEAAR